ncbi:MAG: hypothetical protein WDN48_15200, partial [Pseudolabrys sp.]
MIIEGKVHVLGDSVDTDGMVAGRYLPLSDPKDIAKHIFEDVDPGFRTRVKPGDVLVAGRNFGSGSGREHAPLGLIGLGVGCIVAESFSRTFFRMAVDLGLQTVTCPEAAAAAKDGDVGAGSTPRPVMCRSGRSTSSANLCPLSSARSSIKAAWRLMSKRSCRRTPARNTAAHTMPAAPRRGWTASAAK